MSKSTTTCTTAKGWSSFSLPAWLLLLLLVVVAYAPSKVNADKVLINGDGDNDNENGGTYEYERAIVSGIRRVIDMAWTPDGKILVAGKGGEIYIFEGDLENDSTKLIKEVDPCTEQERALLSIAVHPKFGQRGDGRYDYVYAYWVHKGKNGNCEPLDYDAVNEDGPYCQLSRFKLTVDNALVGEEVLLKTGNAGKMHNGGGMAFGKDEFLYLATGDTGYRRSQNPSNKLDNLWGKVLRLKDDGSVPEDNPYFDENEAGPCGNRVVNPGDGTKRICSEIFATGLRNPFSLEMNPNTASDFVEFHVSDVGWTDWEEINVGGTGYERANYGWKEREGPCTAGETESKYCGAIDNSDLVDPIHFYRNPIDGGAACVGGAFVPNGIWPEKYDNEYLYSDLRGKSIFHMKRDPDKKCRGTECFLQKSAYVGMPIVNEIEGHSVLRLRFGPHSKERSDDVSLFHLLYNSGFINRLTYIKGTDNNNSEPKAVIEMLYSSNSDGVTVHFDGSKSNDQDGDSLEFEWNFGDDNDNDDNLSDDAVTSHTYKHPGRFTATLTVRDSMGKSSKASGRIDVDTDYHRSSDNDNGEPTLATFLWSDHCDVDLCGILEFCSDGDTYGYQHEGGDCSIKMGVAPVIRVEPGKTYRLTLLNLALDETNIHTHGLHVVGSGDGDDVTRIVQGGGTCMDYIWDIRADHPGGTHWYHPHVHSLAEEQVHGGASGLLIVEDNTETNDDIPNWASNELLLQILRLDGGEKMLSNGRAYEIFKLMVGRWYRLRVSTVDPLGVPQELRFTPGCEIHKVASDGVWHSVVPFDRNATDKFAMTGSSRGDFAIQCNSPDSYINVLFDNKLAAIINVESATSPKQAELGKWKPKRPLSLQSMLSASVPVENRLVIEVNRESINGKEWNPEVALKTIEFNQVHEWELPDTRTHPFHVHLYHMQVVTPGGCGDGHMEGEFYDTISAPSCTVRFRTSDFGQRLVVHCHVMLHSDLGSMGWFDVQGPGMPLYKLTGPYHDCAGNSVPPPGPYMGGADNCKVFDELPFTAKAMQFCAYSDSTVESIGECGVGPVDGHDNLSNDMKEFCESDCYIGSTTQGEYVTYKFRTDSGRQGIKVKARMASHTTGKKFRMTLLNANLESDILMSPSEGYTTFKEVLWTFSEIPEGLNELRVEFLDDNINLCAIAVELDNIESPSTRPIPPASLPPSPLTSKPNTIPLPPITWGALDYDDAFESTPGSSTGGCNERGDGVDAQHTTDNTCLVRDGSECNVGWWDAGEYLLYRFSIPQGEEGKYNILVRAASAIPGRDIGMDLMTVDGSFLLDSISFEVLADGWQNFSDIVWKSVHLVPNDYAVKVLSTTGHVNLCSISVVMS